MWSFSIMNRITKEKDIIFGYNEEDARRRANLEDDNNWICYSCTYED